MPGRFGPTDFAACARCGSGQVHPKLLVMGPIAGVDSDSRSYVCHACGYEGLPIFFDTEAGRAPFGRGKKGIWGAGTGTKNGPASLPIRPIRNDTAIAMRIRPCVPCHVRSSTRAASG